MVKYVVNGYFDSDLFLFYEKLIFLSFYNRRIHRNFGFYNLCKMLFCGLTSQSTAMVMSRRSVNLTTLPGQA